MSNLEDAKKRLQVQMAKVKQHREQVLKNMGLEEKDFAAKPICSLCGGYVHVAAEDFCKKHCQEFEGKFYCLYCLSNITDYSVDELKKQYAENKG